MHIHAPRPVAARERAAVARAPATPVRRPDPPRPATPAVDARIRRAPQPDHVAPGEVGPVVIVIAKDDGMIVIKSDSGDRAYLLDSEDVPLGVHEAKVTIGNKGKDVELEIDSLADRAQLFSFRYRIVPGQENPATLLRGQTRATIEVIQRLPDGSGQGMSGCLLPLRNQILFPRQSFERALFPTATKDFEWSFGRIPLGFLGFVGANARAHVAVSGLMAAGWSDALLTDICLAKRVGKDVLEGSARLGFSVAARPSIHAMGELEISADYLGAFSVAAVTGRADIRAHAQAKASVDARVELRYDLRKASWSFAADSRLDAEASMGVEATAAAAIKLVGFEVWSKQWKLADAQLGLGWQGGLQIGTDAKPRLHFGRVGALAQADRPAAAEPSLRSADASSPAADSATVDHQTLVAGALAPGTGEPARVPTGRSPADALPFVWRKPLNIYPKTIHIPRAISPDKLDRDDGPTPVTFSLDRRAITVDIGVGEDPATRQPNWPLPVRNDRRRGKTFQYVEATGSDAQKDWLRDRFNDRLRAAGPTLAEEGFDVDHVQDKQFGGADAPHNLWPAELGANRAAGRLHQDQLAAYRRTDGSLTGRWFEIVQVLKP